MAGAGRTRDEAVSEILQKWELGKYIENFECKSISALINMGDFDVFILQLMPMAVKLTVQ